jgi:hypothetical protein
MRKAALIPHTMVEIATTTVFLSQIAILVAHIRAEIMLLLEKDVHAEKNQ